MVFIRREPQSMQSIVVERAFKRANVGQAPAAPPAAFLVRQYAKSILSSAPTRAVRARLKVRSIQVAGSPIHALFPESEECARLVLYLHGGSYIATFTRQHWNFLAKLAEKSQSIIIAPDYPLAPEHRWSDAYCMLFELWDRLQQQSLSANISLMGDSAGGGMALGFAQALRDAHRALPSSVIMLSPWLDVTLSNPRIDELSPRDPFLNVKSLREAGKAWAGASNPRRYEISPLYGSMRGLPPMSLFIGTNDVLLSDCRSLWNICAVTGAHLDYYEYEHMMHDWMMMPIRESKFATDQIAGILLTQGACADPLGVVRFFEEAEV